MPINFTLNTFINIFIHYETDFPSNTFAYKLTNDAQGKWNGGGDILHHLEQKHLGNVSSWTPNYK